MRTGDTATFDTKRYEKSVAEMRTRGEEVHDRGRDIYRKTGHLDPLVNIHGQLRVSHNSMKKDGEKCILTNGIALPIWSGFDGTGSMGENAARAHAALGEINAMLDGIRGRYNPQLATSVIQDVDDEHPVFQMSQFETDDRIAEQIRLLIPDHNGGDAPEDYQLGLAYLMMATHTDISDFYGLKGYGMVVGDQIGREKVSVESVNHHLGHKLQSAMSTKSVGHQLLPKWHIFYVHVGSGDGGERDFATKWWDEILGKGRTVVVPDPNLLAEVQAGLIYVCETAEPTADGLTAFLTAEGSNKKITAKVAKEIWDWIVDGGVEFGAQTKLPGYGDIPLPGSVFAHYRHQWPEGHSKFEENFIPVDPVALDPSPTMPKSERVDWSKF